MSGNGEPMLDPVVSWTFDPGDEPWLNRVLETTTDFLALVREVGSDVLPRTGLRWAVESLSMQSPLRLRVRPVATRPTVTRRQLEQVTNAIGEGFRLIATTGERPAHFTDAALERAKKLALDTAGGARMSVGNDNSAPVELNSELIARIDALLGATVIEVGTIEGRLEVLNVHGTRRFFTVYDDLTGQPIKCFFGHRIPVATIGPAAERRVSVTGEITYRESGEIVAMAAHNLEVFPDEDDLPSADDVLGIIS